MKSKGQEQRLNIEAKGIKAKGSYRPKVGKEKKLGNTSISFKK